MATNKLTEVAGLVAQAVMGAKVKDKDGNAKTVKPTGDDNLLDLTDIVAGGSTGGDGGGTSQSPVSQLPSTVNLFSGSAVGNILLSGVTSNFDNVQDGLLITLDNQTSTVPGAFNPLGPFDDYANIRMDLSSIGLKGIKIPKDKLIVNGSFDISDQLSQYIGKVVNGQKKNSGSGNWDSIAKIYADEFSFSILSFGGATINVLPNTTLSMNLTVNVQLKDSKNKDNVHQNTFSIPVIQVNDYKK